VEGWSYFLQAEVGASAALVGLIFVGVSINLTKILSIPVLPDRALEAMLLLLSSLIFSSLLLVPHQPRLAIGSEVLGLGVLLWLAIVKVNHRILKNVELEYRKTSIGLVAMSQIAVLSYVAGGVVILSVGFVGMYFLVVAILLSIVKANLDAWVLLVEINR
jgi:modulator of FtsH protease